MGSPSTSPPQATGSLPGPVSHLEWGGVFLPQAVPLEHSVCVKPDGPLNTEMGAQRALDPGLIPSPEPFLRIIKE